jgi:hypothetical protein
MRRAELLHMWIYCLLRADHKDGYRVIFSGKERILRAGQFVTGRKRLGDDLGMAPSTAWGRLKVLSDPPFNFLTCESDRWGTIVTICNWETYQRLAEPARQGCSIGTRQEFDTLNNPNTPLNKGVGNNTARRAEKQRAILSDEEIARALG